MPVLLPVADTISALSDEKCMESKKKNPHTIWPQMSFISGEKAVSIQLSHQEGLQCDFCMCHQ